MDDLFAPGYMRDSIQPQVQVNRLFQSGGKAGMNVKAAKGYDRRDIDAAIMSKTFR